MHVVGSPSSFFGNHVQHCQQPSSGTVGVPYSTILATVQESSHCTMGSDGLSIPSQLSIPSHCTMGSNGQNGKVPRHPTLSTSIPTVHPVPLYHGKQWTEWEGPKASHSQYLHPYCQSCPTVPWDTMDRMGRSQGIPLSKPPSQLSFPSHCTMGHSGQNGKVPRHPTLNTTIPTVNPIPLYHGTQWTEWEGPKASHSQYHYPNCQSRPIVPWDTMDRMGRSIGRSGSTRNSASH